MAEFDAWAAYYDYLHQGLPGEAEFYIGQAVKHGGPVLEIGCGTGRLAIPIAMAGVYVTGLDNSRAMLAICREKAKEAGVERPLLKLVKKDMRNFSLASRFPLAIMAYRTFMHCLTPTDQLACLLHIYQHLTPGGELFLNVWAAQPGTITLVDIETQDKRGFHVASIPIPSDKITLQQYISVQRDDFRQLLHERHVIVHEDENGAEVHEEHLEMTRAWITPREMEHLAARAGFDVIAVLGDFDGTRFNASHTEMIWHLRRPL